MFHGRIINDLSMITVDSTTADNNGSTLGTGINDFGDDTGAHTHLYSGQVEGAFGLFSNSINTGNITANISGSNCDHKSCDQAELLSNCDTKDSVDYETHYKFDTCLVDDESVRLSGKNSISLDVASHDHMFQPFCLEKDFVT